MYYQPFWSSHYLTWLAANAIRYDQALSFKSFCRQMECRDDDEAVLILGRNLVKEDITADYVVCGVDAEVLSWLAQAYRRRSYRLFI
jgi:hypothetical protein